MARFFKEEGREWHTSADVPLPDGEGIDLAALVQTARPPQLGIACRPDQRDLAREALGRLRDEGATFDVKIVTDESIPEGKVFLVNFDYLAELIDRAEALGGEVFTRVLADSKRKPFVLLSTS